MYLSTPDGLSLTCRLAALPTLPWLPHLQDLNLQDNEVTSVQPLLSCPQLTALNLSFNAIADLDSIAAISPCTTLRSLSLHDNPVLELPGYADMRLEVCAPPPEPGVHVPDHWLPKLTAWWLGSHQHPSKLASAHGSVASGFCDDPQIGNVGLWLACR